MCSTRDIVIFLAGAEALHTISHLFIGFAGRFPVDYFFITWNKQLNLFGIIINGLITLGLLWWASRLG